MDYLVAVQAPAYPISATSFAVESAFAEHLKALRTSVGSRFARLVLVAPRLSEADFASQQNHLGRISLEEDQILFLPAHPLAASPAMFWLRHAWPIWRQVGKILAGGAVVHSGMSTDIWRPLMALVNFAGLRAHQPVIFMVDIDFRQHSRRFYHLGVWNLKAYLVNRLLHDPLKWLQVWLAPRLFQLVMLKSASMVRDFGNGRSHVKNFFDTAHSEEHLLPAAGLDRRLAGIRGGGALKLVYFGRLVLNKGVDRIIDAVAMARDRGAAVELTVIGDGPCLASLQRQVAALKLDGAVRFLPQIAYGPELFDRLDEAHLMAAAPLIEDTPRAAFDAMARGLPIVAFDISYFRDLAECSGAVALSRWPDAGDLAGQIVTLHDDRERLAEMAAKSLAFATDNTQQAWLTKRAAWMREFALGEGGGGERSREP